MRMLSAFLLFGLSFVVVVVAVRSRAFSVSKTDSADQGERCDFLVPSFRPTGCTLCLQGGNGQEKRLVNRSLPLPACWFSEDQLPCSELYSVIAPDLPSLPNRRGRNREKNF